MQPTASVPPTPSPPGLHHCAGCFSHVNPLPPEFGFATLTGVLPTDQANQVVDAGVGDGHHRHGMHFLLSHGQVDVDLLGGRGADVTLKAQRRE